MRDSEASETEPARVEQPRRLWWTAAHMLGFGLLLALAILLAKGPPVDRADGGRVVFTEADLAHVRAAFERTWSRPPSAAELRKAFDHYVRDEVLYREALARGLDRDDPLVKMSLVNKITMLGTVAAENREPTDAELKAYFDLRSERYRIPASFDLMQVSLSRDKHGEQIDAVAAERLAQLRNGARTRTACGVKRYCDVARCCERRVGGRTHSYLRDGVSKGGNVPGGRNVGRTH